jgi:hypothetical protein
MFLDEFPSFGSRFNTLRNYNRCWVSVLYSEHNSQLLKLGRKVRNGGGIRSTYFQ